MIKNVSREKKLRQLRLVDHEEHHHLHQSPSLKIPILNFHKPLDQLGQLGLVLGKSRRLVDLVGGEDKGTSEGRKYFFPILCIIAFFGQRFLLGASIASKKACKGRGQTGAWYNVNICKKNFCDLLTLHKLSIL